MLCTVKTTQLRTCARPTLCCARAQRELQQGRRAVLALVPTLVVTSVVGSSPAADVEPFLKSTGARGFLADEEEKAVALRKERELLARDEFDRERMMFEQEARTQQRGLCATPFGVDVVGITEAIALIGALVGGLVARQRKKEAERLNEQLRKINMQLRQQARAGTVYAPGLSYAPVGRQPSITATTATIPLTVTDTQQATQATTPRVQAFSSTDEELSPEQERCRQVMREGKRLLRSNQGAAALVRFEKALLMSQKLMDRILQRRALRGMAASSRMVGNNPKAIKYLKQVLEISEQMKEYTGDADAYGSIADIYADMGEFEKAATYYDSYINKMQEDGQAV
eukprot:jgi/Ulvmu1/9413/UM051_0041.1